MPKKKKEVLGKIKQKKNIFVLAVLAIVFLMFSIPYFMEKNISLSCSRSDRVIKCTWANCQPKTEEASGLTIAKAPNYVENVEIKKETGWVAFSPSPLMGTYAVLISCRNGEVAQKIVVG